MLRFCPLFKILKEEKQPENKAMPGIFLAERQASK